MALPRLRQAVVAAVDFDETARALEAALGVAAPFHDEGIIHFGLRNAVYAVGDTFVEIVSPVRDDTAAGRQIARAGGDCGYMCMFEVADEQAIRARISEIGARVVHDTTHPDIVDIHLHPKDIPGAIVALDVTNPVGSWRWGGPPWEAAVAPHGPGGLRGLTVAVRQPHAAARLWAGLLGQHVDGTTVDMDDGAQRIDFIDAEDGIERIVEVRVATVMPTGESVVAGVRFAREPIEPKETA